jgi:putative glutamine amidotransferase
MSSERIKPVVGITAGTIFLHGHSVPQYGSGDRYIRAVVKGACATPFLIPSLGDVHDFEHVVENIDGLFLPGGRANVEPHHYEGPPFPEDEIRDPRRDATVLPLIRACIDAGVPVFGVCRGHQEINVALGGTLHYRVHLLEGKLDHRMPREGDIEHKFGLRHPVILTEGGYFGGLAKETQVMVNSLHGQGVEKLAPGTDIEAVAPDGLIEGFSVSGAKRFAVGVQWHAEWRYDEHGLATELFREFGEAATDRARERRGRR